MNFKEMIVWVILGLLVLWFINSSSILQIILGVIILGVLLLRDSTEKKAKNTLLERASHETFYDTMKWVAFGIFVVIYPTYLKSSIMAFLITIFLFILILFGLNILKERNAPKK